MNRYAIPVAVLVLSLVAGTVLYRSISSTRERHVVEADFFTPYFAAIGQGRYAEAWKYHTPNWQMQHSLEVFTLHYKGMIAKYGTINRHSVLGTKAVGANLTVEYQIFFESHLVPVSYELVPQPEYSRWGIESTVSAPDRNTALPW